MGTTRKYWKDLDEANQTPEYLEAAKNEFPAELSVDEFLADDKLQESSTGRRDFLKFLGFSVAAATLAACEAPVIKSVPYVVKPEEITPGIANWYASTYYDGSSYASILVKSREGRPIHLKGNRDYGISSGAVNAQIQASVLSLYDSQRLSGPKGGEGWKSIDNDVRKQLKKIAKSGKKIVLLSNTVCSPSGGSAIIEFQQAFVDSRPAPDDQNPDLVEGGGEDVMPMMADGPVKHIQYDAISYSGIREANLESFGQRVIPDYDFAQAKVIVSVACDFLNSWVFPTRFVGGYTANRNPDHKWMSRHHQFETNMSMTGSNADIRGMITPAEQGKVLALLHKKVTGKAIGGIETGSLDKDVQEKVITAAAELKAAKGRSLVVAGSNRKSIQVIVNSINHKLGNYKSVINLNDPINMHQSEDDKMQDLIADMDKKKVGAVIMWDVNPVYSLSAGDSEKFVTGLGKVGLSISMSRYEDETSKLCTYICPDHHALEAWNDYNPKKSHYSLAQPTIRPLYNTRNSYESLLVWATATNHKGKESSTYYKYIKKLWLKHGFPNQSTYLDKRSYWNAMVHNSCGNITAGVAAQKKFKGNLSAAGKAEKGISAGAWQIALYQKAGLGNGNMAGNPWLQELPDPVSKVTWDNYATMAPSDMQEMDLSMRMGQEQPQNIIIIKVDGQEIKLPAFPQPGQKKGTIGMAVGYGRGKGGEKIGKGAYHTEQYGEWTAGDNGGRKMIGQNAFALAASGACEIFAADISATEEEYTLATTQTHSTVMARNSIVKETTFSIYKGEGKEAYNPAFKLHSGWNHDEKHISEFDLWDAHPVEHVGHRWGMTIDLNSCIGCGSCLIACQSENNVPVVGKDEVRRSRELHWIRIDRYYASDVEPTVGTRDKEKFNEGGFDALEIPSENPKVIFMPMLCQHCTHAPCETVCPVAATTHSNEGLNQMVYNRCIGTRYCANNCPYKVRRFNWFNYPSYRKFTEINPAQDDLGRMVLNPDVVVRTRGVMEKCSFCVQKIQAGKLVAKKADRPVSDSDITTACEDSCPTNAIAFGDWNDVDSEVRKGSQEDRAYQALEDVGVKPSIWYKVKVRNEENEALAAIQQSDDHGGGHEGAEEEGHHDDGHHKGDQDGH